MSRCVNVSPYKMSNENNIVNEEEQQEHHSTNTLENNNNNININNNCCIRRTISADMSSPKWQQNNGFSMKRIQSSEDVNVLGENYECENDELNEKKSGCGSGGAAFEDIWSSILSQKKEGTGSGDSDTVPAPYVHPLVKRASSLSEKSLEICTESLGSETGSDGFSYIPSDHSEEHETEEEEEEEEDMVEEKQEVVKSDFKSNYFMVSKKKVSSGVVRSFPPPLPSLANRDDGSNLEMRTRRQDGRLLLEAVSIPSRNWFRARREDGRLLLTLTSDNVDDEQEMFDDVVEDVNEGEIEVVSEDVGVNVEKVLTLLVEEKTCLPMTKMINVHKASSEMIMTKLMELTSTRNMSTWPRSSNRAVITSLDEGADDGLSGKQVEVESMTAKQKVITKSLPPRPRVSTATSAADVLNAYEYYWRRSDSATAAAVAVLKPLAGKQNSPINCGTISPQAVVKDNNNRINKLVLEHNLKGSLQENEVVLVKAATVGGEYLVPILRGCKEPKRSLFFWEPFCIATS